MPLFRTLRSGETIEVKHPIERKVAFWEHGRDPNDQAWSNSIQRRDAVIARAPACGEAWSLVDTVNLRRSIVPVDMERAPYVPAGEPFGSGLQVVDYYAEHPTHAAGIVTGPQSGEWGLLAIRDDTGTGWGAWESANLAKSVDRGPQFADKGERGTVVRSMPPHGQAVMVAWEPIPADDPYHLPKVGPTLRGNVDRAGTLEALRSMTVASSPSVHRLLPYLGTWTFKRRSLADGLTVWPTGAVVPVAGVHEGSALRLHNGGVLSLNAGDLGWYGWAPAWLLANLGGRR
jgi:hypothetical protein